MRKAILIICALLGSLIIGAGANASQGPICNVNAIDGNRAVAAYCYSPPGMSYIRPFRAVGQCVDGYGEQQFIYGPQRITGRGQSSITGLCPWPYYLWSYWAGFY